MGLNKIKELIKHKVLSIKPNSQYNFLTKKIYKSQDIDLITDILKTDYFKEQLVPQPIKYENWKRIIVFAPHQDDEAIGCGGLLNQLKTVNCKVDLVYLTDGRPISNNAEKIVKIRREESHQVAKILNASITNIGINNVTLHVNKNHLNKISSLFQNNKYDAIFTPWVLDYPPKHRLCNFILYIAFKKINLEINTQIFNYQVHNFTLPNVFFDYTSNFKNKQELIKTYQSQLKNQNYAHLSEGMDSWNSRLLNYFLEARYIETYHQIPLNAYYKLIDLYKKDIKKTFRSHQKCIESYQSLDKI